MTTTPRRVSPTAWSLGAILASLAFCGGCGREAAVRTNSDSGPANENTVEAGDDDSGALDAANEGSADGTADGGALLSGDASASMAAGMNDVSILFPMPTSIADIDNLLAPSTFGVGGPLFPSELYASLGSITGSTVIEIDAGPPLNPTFFPPTNLGLPEVYIAAYDDLRVVAMRVDPCFASLAPDPSGAGCTAQLRLIFQEVRWEDAGTPPAYSSESGAAVFDSAIHAFYDLSRAQFLSLARALIDLRIANENGDSLGPLAPHPIMVRQGLGGPMSQGVQRLILQYAGEQNLVRVAESGIVDFVCDCPSFAGKWGMSVFDVQGLPAAATARAIPTLVDVNVDGGSVFAQFMVLNAGPVFDVSPTTTASDDYLAIYNPFPLGGLPSSTNKAGIDALLRVENPRYNSPDTIDCASCHMADQTARNDGLDAGANPLAYAPEGTMVARGDMQATFPEVGFDVNTHVFSYRSGASALAAPTISQRVVNETASVVEYVNALPR
jgi:hypothetical protein